MDQQYKAAQKRVKQKKGFFVHFAVYLSVGLFFFLMNLATFEGDWWFFFPLLPWGMGLGIHYLITFGFPGSGVLSREWEEKELQKNWINAGCRIKAGTNYRIRQKATPSTSINPGR